ncbi:MAG: S1 RNA-binding domain-containing protein [Gammaproteobacteria bacterium]|nr:S1 RNA-binding domain-containing protein [Gammaproteobacteria bacterium]
MTALTGEAEIGQVYTGKVVKIVNFGAFVNLKPGKDGLVHISQIAEYRIESVEAELSEGQTVNVKVLDVDEQGRVKLTMKEVQPPQAGE